MDRVDGGITTVLRQGPRGTNVCRLRERDGYRMRCPSTGTGFEGVIINTGGGMVGGDTITFNIEATDGADVVMTTQSAERVYRAEGSAMTRVSIALAAGPGSKLAWMPQETIAFDGCRFERTIDANVAPDAQLLVLEIFVAGRKASGETLRRGLFRDTWRMHVDGRLAFAENVRLSGDIAAQWSRESVAGAAHATGVLVLISNDATDHLARVRAMLDANMTQDANMPLAANTSHPTCRIVASAWDRQLIVRGLSTSVEALRRQMASLAAILAGRSIPRVWQIA